MHYCHLLAPQYVFWGAMAPLPPPPHGGPHEQIFRAILLHQSNYSNYLF